MSAMAQRTTVMIVSVKKGCSLVKDNRTLINVMMLFFLDWCTRQCFRWISVACFFLIFSVFAIFKREHRPKRPNIKYTMIYSNSHVLVLLRLFLFLRLFLASHIHTTSFVIWHFFRLIQVSRESEKKKKKREFWKKVPKMPENQPKSVHHKWT